MASIPHIKQKKKKKIYKIKTYGKYSNKVVSSCKFCMISGKIFYLYIITNVLSIN